MDSLLQAILMVVLTSHLLISSMVFSHLLISSMVFSHLGIIWEIKEIDHMVTIPRVAKVMLDISPSLMVLNLPMFGLVTLQLDKRLLQSAKFV